MFKKNDVVRVKIVIPEGPIAKMRMDDDGNVEYLVEWTAGSGTVQQRWFREDQIEAVG